MNEREIQQKMLGQVVMSLKVDVWKTELENLERKSLYDIGAAELLNTLKIKTTRLGWYVPLN